MTTDERRLYEEPNKRMDDLRSETNSKLDDMSRRIKRIQASIIGVFIVHLAAMIGLSFT